MTLPILLDTCALIFMAEDELAGSAVAALGEAYAADRPALVSPISAWELGLLCARGRLKLVIDPLVWFRRMTALPGLAISQLTDEVLMASSFLPGSPPRDPADRIVIASARERGAAVMTRDKSILAYAGEGHVAAIEC